MAQQELKIIHDFYDFMLWMIKHIEKYPHHHRYTLGVDSTMKDLKNMKRGKWWAKKNYNANNLFQSRSIFLNASDRTFFSRRLGLVDL